MKELSCAVRIRFLRSLHLLVFVGLSLSVCPSFAVTSTPFWKSPVIVGSADRLLQQGDRFLAYDNLGVPNIATAHGVGVTLSRQVPGLGWRSRVIASSATNDANGASIAINRREQPAISYGDSAGLHYVAWDALSSSFVDFLVDDSSVSLRTYTAGTSIAFDLTGRPAIAAVDTNLADTWYVTDTDNDGTLSSFDSPEMAIGFEDVRPTLAFDGGNRPIVGGIDGGFFDVGVKDTFIGWSQTTVAGGLGSSTEPTSVANGSVAIDPDDGLPGVAWTNQNTRQLSYAKWDTISNSWVTELVATAPAGIHFSNESLTFDPGDGHPAISYSDDAGKLFFAWHDGGSWNTQEVQDTGTGLPLRTSLDFNEYGHGFPAIAYIDGFGTVLFTVDPPIAAVPESSAVALALFLPAALVFARHRRWRAN